MNSSRRKVLQSTGGMAVMGLAMAAGLFKPGSAWAQDAWNKAAFSTKSLNDTVKAMGGATRRGEQGHPDQLARHRRERRGRAVHDLEQDPEDRAGRAAGREEPATR